MSIQITNVPMALQFAGAAPPLEKEINCLSWSPEAAGVLKTISGLATATAKRKHDLIFLNLPYVTLRTCLQLAQTGWISLARDVGTNRATYDSRSPPFGYIDAALVDKANLNDTLARWVDGPLSHFVQKYEVPIISIERLRALISQGGALEIESRGVRLFPWGADQKGGPSPFEVTPGGIASMLMGLEIFPDLGPVVRVLNSTDVNDAELMTSPLAGPGGQFSLVCHISMETLPGAEQPLIYLGFSRRRWATSLVEKPFKSKRIGGYVFAPVQRPDAAFRFDVDFDSKSGWLTDQAYSELELQLRLTRGFADARIVEYPAQADTQALVMHSYGIAEADESAIDAGVPVADQLACFGRVLEALRPHGFVPFTSFKEISRKAVSMPRLSVIRAPLVLSQLLQLSDGEGAQESMSSESIEQRVVQLTKRSLSEWFGKKKPGLDAKYGNLAGLVSDVVRSSGIGSDNERRTLYVLVQSAEEIPWVRTVVGLMLGDSVRLLVGEVPKDTHGPKGELPEANAKVPGRLAARVAAWTKFSRSQKFDAHPMFLIQADQWYTGGSRPLPDDTVNKAAGRRTLATELGATVQYLLPARDRGLDNYLMRLQAAILDLVYGHAGRVLGLSKAIDKAFTVAQSRPSQVAAVGSISVNMGAKQGTILAAVRIGQDGEVPVIKLAHMESDAIFTPWMRFDDGLKYVAGRSRLELPNKKERPSFFQKFMGELFDEVAHDDANAVIFIDSTRHAGLWKRLADRTVMFGPQALDGEANPRGGWKGLRIVRIREQTPTMVNVREGAATLEDGRQLDVATSVKRLFSISGAVAPTYWSFAPPTSQHKRGTSCYRAMVLPSEAGRTELFPAAYGQHQTPRGTEFVVLQAQANDEPDRIAGFAEQLRVGVPQARGNIWVRVPSPLYILEKLRDYMTY